MKKIGLFICILVGGFLAYGTIDMPKFGDANTPANRHVSDFYIAHAAEDTHTPNVVTAVLADYRGYDTMGETTVIFCAGMSCLLILKRLKKKD